MTRNRKFFKINIVSLLLLAIGIVLLSGCSDLQIIMDREEYIPDVSVNSKIYSNDYILDEGPVEGGSVRIYATKPDTFNPLLTKNIYVREITGLVYEGITRINSSLEAEYSLAESWTTSEDGLTWTIELKKDLFWHDGKPFSADDVIETVRRIRNYGTNCPYFESVTNIKGISATSESQLVLKLHKVNSFTPEMLAFPIVPKHIDIDELNSIDFSPDISRAMIGTGPYKNSTYRSGESITLIENTAHKEKPYIKNVTFVFYDTSISALSRFREKEVDAFISKNIEYFRYKDSTEMQIKRYSDREFEMLAFNCQNSFINAKVRYAISKMIDRSDLVKTELNGRGIEAELPVPPDSWLYDLGYVPSLYDPETGKRLLEENGFRLENGVYYRNANGQKRRLELRLLVNMENSDHINVAQRIALKLSEHGIIIHIVPEKYDTLVQKISERDFDIAFVSYRVQAFPDLTELYSTSYFRDNNQLNVAGYQNEEVDRLARELYIEHDKWNRQNTFLELAAIIENDWPYIGLYFQASTLVMENEIKGDITPNVWNPYSQLEKWYITDYR